MIVLNKSCVVEEKSCCCCCLPGLQYCTSVSGLPATNFYVMKETNRQEEQEEEPSKNEH